MRSTRAPAPVRLRAARADWAFATADGARYRTDAAGTVTVQPQQVPDLVRRGFTPLPPAPAPRPAPTPARTRKAR